jgi:predicted acylesterase/phospholipase RssA
MENKKAEGPTPYSAEGFDLTHIPDYDVEFISQADLDEFAKALSAPEDPLDTPLTTFITALNDWRPIHQRVRRRIQARRKKRPQRRGPDETREGFAYALLKWPFLIVVLAWLLLLSILYLLTRFYIFLYEQLVTWRGRRATLRRQLRQADTYDKWVQAAKEMDDFLGSKAWKTNDAFAYYDYRTVRKVRDQMRDLRERAEEEENNGRDGIGGQTAVEKLRQLVHASVKSNFAGLENAHLYSQTYYGTKDLAQSYLNETEKSLALLLKTTRLSKADKRVTFKHLYTNYGRSALCLSGGATFAYYHFGVVKALLDANLMPTVITGTSGGALIAALVATRTDEELKQLLIPALANKITACEDSMMTWLRRWWKTGARFDSIEWARKSSWFTRGSMTFREAYERTGRILNVSCVPSDPHSPTILANYLTSPDCVIWSAVLASAAVPGILNPVVLMMKTRDGTLAPYSFGHKWKDGSLRTDIPLRALNMHFNVNFSIVSQVNPHVNLFFFSSRGSVGKPVTHRRGRGWRGGFLGSAVEQYLKLDLTKWLKVLRHLELLPRPLGQDWSEVFLQRFSGTITLWPKTVVSDFYYILSDPTPHRLSQMLHAGQQSAFPILNFLSNRILPERLIEAGWRATRLSENTSKGLSKIMSDEDLRSLLADDDQGGMTTQSDDDGHSEDPVRYASSDHSSVSQEDPIQSNRKLSRSDSSLATLFSNWIPSYEKRQGSSGSINRTARESRQTEVFNESESDSDSEEHREKLDEQLLGDLRYRASI